MASPMLRAAGALAAALVAGCASTPVPPVLDPGPGSVAAFTYAARGVQIYECRAAAWAFVAPEAELRDAGGRVVGRHGAGPFWQADDGSRIVGRVTARADAPAAGAIPWLLLATRPEAGDGVLARVTHVQRLHTRGGVAPAAPCTSGTQARVDYDADYRFFVSR